jgi:hypothetical protein
VKRRGWIWFNLCLGYLLSCTLHICILHRLVTIFKTMSVFSILYSFQEMGIPIKRFICASNENNVLTEFLNSGRYDLQNRQLIRTSSPAIDILLSSNLERYLYHVSNRNSSLVRSCFGSLETNRYFEVPSEVFRYEISTTYIYLHDRHISNYNLCWKRFFVIFRFYSIQI